MTNKQQIQQLVDSISITPERRIWLNGKPWGEAFSNPYTTQPSMKMLFQSVQQLIYSVYYTRAGVETTGTAYPQPHEIEAFINELSSYNSNTEQFDTGWQIEQIDLQGAITACKGNYKRMVLPGEFINESGFQQKPYASAAIRLYARKEHKSIHTGFYYMFGKTLAEDNNDLLVRLYFNIKAEGAKELVAALSLWANKFAIPFSFKCLYHPSLYTRADAAVLYFDKRYSSIVFRLLPHLYPLIKAFLKPDIPLFTKKIAPGIGFAENPHNPEESFGTHTSKMIAQAIIHSINHTIQPAQWAREVLDNIQQRHQYKDIEQLYCNPGSVYPYYFPTISTQ